MKIENTKQSVAQADNLIDSKIIDCRKISRDLLHKCAERVSALDFVPILCDVVVGNDPVSMSYVKIKEKRALECGLGFKVVHLPETSTTDDVVAAVRGVQDTKHENGILCGLIVQLPLPGHINTQTVLDAIDISVDVDLINPMNTQKFYTSKKFFGVPGVTHKNLTTQVLLPTPSAILEIISRIGFNFSEKKIAIFGHGVLVGKPLAHILKHMQHPDGTPLNAQVSVIDINTPNPDELLSQADLVVSAVGKHGILRGKSLKQGVVVIDAGSSEVAGSGEVKGDADFESVHSIAGLLTTVPGGVGPVTVAKLIENTVIYAENKSHQQIAG
jgi:methylenetetrahydrofolate dehydrogenase (NADP+) / methenyltetrahydrofolate cyclohydrolase